MTGAYCVRALLAGSVLLLAACALATQPLTMEIPATNDTLSGAIHFGTGAQDVTLTSDNGQLACNGVSLREYAVPGCETTGSLRLHCTDGRDITGNWRMNDCESGAGSGEDRAGNAVRFVIGATGGATDTESAPPGASAPGPAGANGDVPGERFLFRLGNGYAAGFGSADSAGTVFSDAETGLFIVKLDAVREFPPVAFMETAPHADQEAFLLLPAEAPGGSMRLKRTSIVPAAGSGWKLAGDSEFAGLPPGLPVMNREGRLLGLTNGANILGAGPLRRYLGLIAPGFFKHSASAESLEMLGKRVMLQPAAVGRR